LDAHRQQMFLDSKEDVSIWVCVGISMKLNRFAARRDNLSEASEHKSSVQLAQDDEP